MTFEEALPEIVERFREGFTGPAYRGLEVGLVAVVVAAVLRFERAKASAWKVASVVLALGAAAFGIKLALDQAWIADDAFISFRYARNFAEGNGLVWNVGERLEGYTNFLWTVLLGLTHALGIHPAFASTAMTLGCVLALAVVGAWKLNKPGWVPIAPLLLVLSPAFVEFGTSGLEAGPAAMCIGFAALWLVDERTARFAPWWVLIAALLRPDHALFFAPLGLVALFSGRRALGQLLAAGAGFGVYWLGRWAYFGTLFPNTFHAKSGGGAYWSQGLTYWAEFALATGLWLAVPAAVVVGLLLAVTPREPRAVPHRVLVFGSLSAALYTAYIARVGGDFMEFRFGLTTLVLVAFTADAMLSALASTRTWAAVLGALALLPLGVTPQVIKPAEKKWHLARESSFYPVKSWRPFEIHSSNWTLGLSLASLPDEGAHAPPLAAGCIGMVGYLSRVPIIDRYGLTNANIARKPIKERGRPGHEKYGSIEELMAEGAVWSVDPSWGAPLEATTRFRLGTWDFWLLKDTDALKQSVPGVPDAQHVLSSVRSPAEARELLETVARVYADRPGVLEEYLARWGILDARQVVAKGRDVQQTTMGIWGRERVELSLHRSCPRPVRVRWQVSGGTCTQMEANCVNGVLDASWTCEGPALRVDSFTQQPMTLEERLAWARPLGPGALADVLREEEDAALPGLVKRFHFDEPSDLDAPGVKQSARIYEVFTGTGPAQAPVHGFHGKGFLNGYAHGDAPEGTLQLAVPVEPNKPVLVSFLFAGGSACDLIEARVLDGERQVDHACARQDEVLRSFATVVTPQTAELRIEVVDRESNSWGHALLDDVIVWRMP